MQIAVDDATIDLELVGSGEPVVLIHGFPFTRQVWDAQAAQLSSSARVIRPDLRGMGQSSVPGGPYLMETLAGDIAAVLDALGIRRAAIVGHSAGGYVAMAFCRMYTERVTRLALVCSRLAADTAQEANARDALADRIEREHRIDAVLQHYIPRLFSDGNAQSGPLVETAERIARANSVSGTASFLRGIAQRVDGHDMAEELNVPVTIIAGAKDQVVSRAEAQAMCAAFPRAELRLLPESGHLPMLEQPGALADMLGTFLAGDA